MATAESIATASESVFDIGERLTGLLKQAREEAIDGAIPGSVLARLAESIATICAEEAERLSARKRAAERRLRSRLKEMLLAFMTSRGVKRLEGERAAVGLRANSMASLVIDDALHIGEYFFEKSLRFTKTEFQEIVYQLADGQLRRRLETALTADGWEINVSAVRFAITNGSNISGARLVKGHHVRLW